MVETIKAELLQYADSEKTTFLPKFFGIKVPDQRKVARKYYKQISLADSETLLHGSFHEHRLTALIILVYKYEKVKTIAELN